jgi:hypothetical protein
MRLTKSALEGVHLIAFDMHVRPRQPSSHGKGVEQEGDASEPLGWSGTPLEVWLL